MLSISGCKQGHCCGAQLSLFPFQLVVNPMSELKSSKVVNQPAKKTGCSEAVRKIFAVAEAVPFTGFIVIGQDTSDKPYLALCGFGKEQILWHLMVVLTNLSNDCQSEIDCDEPSAESNPVQAKIVKKILKQVKTRQLNKVVVVGDVGGKTVMSSTGFTKKQLSCCLVAAARFSINYGDLLPQCTE